jgi:Mce-associated membrane protein
VRRLIVAALVLAGAAALTMTLYFMQYRPDQRTNEAVTKEVTQAASDGTVALLSYAPESLDRDLTAAKSRLTGEFLAYYRDFTDQVLGPAATQKTLEASASVVQAAVSELRPGSAKVLVLLDQTTTSKDNPKPVRTASNVMVTLTKIDGTWLISAFDPV